MSIEEQIRTIAKQELESQIAELDKRFQEALDKEVGEVKAQIDDLNENIGSLGSQIESRFRGVLDKEVTEVKGQVEGMAGQLEEISARLGKLEEDLSNRWGLVVKLRKYTLDQLMSEYKRLTGSMRPEQEEPAENAET